jgi:hypothetical protein
MARSGALPDLQRRPSVSHDPVIPFTHDSCRTRVTLPCTTRCLPCNQRRDRMPARQWREANNFHASSISPSPSSTSHVHVLDSWPHPDLLLLPVTRLVSGERLSREEPELKSAKRRPEFPGRKGAHGCRTPLKPLEAAPCFECLGKTPIPALSLRRRRSPPDWTRHTATHTRGPAHRPTVSRVHDLSTFLIT